MTGIANWIRTNKSLFIFNAALIAFVVLLCWLKPVDPVMDYDLYRVSTAGSQTIAVYGGITVSQSFICDYADAFELYITADNYHGFFDVKLFDASDVCIKSWKTDKLDIISKHMGKNNWLRYAVGEDDLISGEEYRIEISAPELDEATAVNVTTVPRTVSGRGICMINGEESEQILAFSTYRNLGNPFYLIAVILLFATANIWWFNRKKNVVRYALWILTGTGLIMFFLMAPGSQPDEWHHYNSAFKLSNVIMGKTNINEIEKEYVFDLENQTNTNDSFRRVITTILDTAESEPDITLSFGGALERQPAAYLAPALGITLGRLLHGSFMLIYSLGRLFNLVLYIVLAYAAIRLIPVNKELMLLISIIPMAMHQASSMSYDVIVNGISLLFFAYIASFVFEKRTFSWPHAVLCAGMLAIAGPVKVVYCMLILLIFMIPGKQFRHNRDKLIMGLIVVAAIAAVLFILRGDALQGQLSGASFDPSKDYYHGDFVLRHPDRWIRLILGTAETRTWGFIKDGIGLRLSGLNVPVNEIYIIIYLVVLILTALHNSKRKEPGFSTGQKVLCTGIAVAGYAAILEIFSFVWTTYGSALINGAQGRYLLPFAPLVLYSLAGTRISLHIERYRLIYLVWFVEAGFIADVMSQIV